MGDSTSVKFCGCKHDFQDKRFGKNQRLHTKCTDGWRCTVCENKKEGK